MTRGASPSQWDVYTTMFQGTVCDSPDIIHKQGLKADQTPLKWGAKSKQ